MDKRAPRFVLSKQPVYIRQHTGTSENVFVNDALFCYFLYRLNKTKKKYAFRVLAYGLGPKEIHLIILPSKDNLTSITRSLFTSIAKECRHSQGNTGKGSVFPNPYFSQTLLSKRLIDKTKQAIRDDLRKTLGYKLRGWPYLCTDARYDLFKICGNTDKIDGSPNSNNSPYFLFKNGYPTVHWFLHVLDSA